MPNSRQCERRFVVARDFEPLTSVDPQLLDLQIKTVRSLDIKDDDTIITVSEEGLTTIPKRRSRNLSPLRPEIRQPVTNAKALLKRLFFDPKRYDIAASVDTKNYQKLTINVALRLVSYQ